MGTAPKRRAVVPAPAAPPGPPTKHPTLGEPSARWTYLTAKGELAGFVCRFDRKGGKQFRPLVFFEEDDGARAWRWEAWSAPRPLYGLERLAQRPSAPVLLCEGEKAADAAGKLLPGHVCITSPNGAKSAAKADWGSLARRDVMIWPDADEAGAAYARDVTKLALAAGAKALALLSPPDDVDEGWDAADALAEGWTSEKTLALVDAAKAVGGATQAKQASEGKAPRRRPQRDALMALTQFCAFWHGADYEAFATVPVNGHNENWPVRSQAFKR
ncbi:conserved hypothetical protein [Methylocella silvestris BL2]|uniref:Toprim domain-containing protein n=1 Tax=Methylocella silvestris (strain DSM 15510 / CIP 108128 / LMG 27833 / NCIMB 13906 / BL2) TaxID=395965 RepID=B8EI06_METSB|nr:hypothetical protein [Methylocella silvestris]ACK50488.1 conserved hypothetical protein [Methylocella silvestris BL2]